jgi:hypothetical protein
MAPASIPDPGDGEYLFLFQPRELTVYLSPTASPYTFGGTQNSASIHMFHQVSAMVGPHSRWPIDIF